MLRMSTEALRDRINGAMALRGAVRTQRERGRSKYGNQVTVLDGQRFDSKSEAKRFVQLKAMQDAGQISELKTQVVFELIPAQQIGEKKERAVRYVADFTYMKKGQLVIEDVKSAPTKTKEFIIKRKLMMFIHRAVVREILMD